MPFSKTALSSPVGVYARHRHTQCHANAGTYGYTVYRDTNAHANCNTQW